MSAQNTLEIEADTVRDIGRDSSPPGSNKLANCDRDVY